MALLTFTPTVRPSIGAQNGFETSLNQAEFGDGYTLASPNGINHIRRSISLNWAGLTTTNMNAIIAFFVARGGWEPFYFTPFGETEQVKWTCKEWSSTASNPWTISAKLVQSFNLMA